MSAAAAWDQSVMTRYSDLGKVAGNGKEQLRLPGESKNVSPARGDLAIFEFKLKL
jgi:hypothetical protein